MGYCYLFRIGRKTFHQLLNVKHPFQTDIIRYNTSVRECASNIQERSSPHIQILHPLLLHTQLGRMNLILKLGKKIYLLFWKIMFWHQTIHTRSVNWCHSISKNRSSREHGVFNTNNLAILGNNIIIEGPFNHGILIIIEFRKIDMVTFCWTGGISELYISAFQLSSFNNRSFHLNLWRRFFSPFLWESENRFVYLNRTPFLLHLYLQSQYVCGFRTDKSSFLAAGWNKWACSGLTSLLRCFLLFSHGDQAAQPPKLHFSALAAAVNVKLKI